MARARNAAPCRHAWRRLLAVVSAAVLLQLPGQPPALGAGLPVSQRGGQPDPASTSQATPANQPSVYWGAFVLGWPGNPAALDAFEQSAGKRMSIIAWGAAWWHGHDYLPFDTASFQAVRDRGSIPMLSWGSWDYCCAFDQPRFALASIARGDHDLFLIRWARAARAWGHPFFLNFDSEMNGWWWPWSEQVNGNGPGDFVAAWRHVVDIFHREGVTNATWVWCPNIAETLATPLDELYPGDSYVDWTCMDGYNWGTGKGGTWQDPVQVFGDSSYRGGFNTYNLLQQLAPDKPIMVGETAATEDGGSKAAWITDAYTQTLPNMFPAIKAVVWYAWPDESPDLSWGIDTSPDAQAAFASAIALPRYAANNYRSQASSPIQPPDGPFDGS